MQAKGPICGMTVETMTASHKETYKGKTYYFCSAHCHETFKAAPEKHIGATATQKGCCGN